MTKMNWSRVNRENRAIREANRLAAAKASGKTAARSTGSGQVARLLMVLALRREQARRAAAATEAATAAQSTGSGQVSPELARMLAVLERVRARNAAAVTD